METPSKIQCSLCGHFISQSELRKHRQSETAEVITYTINMIKSRHPEWMEKDPSCQMCWDYYRSLPAA